MYRIALFHIYLCRYASEIPPAFPPRAAFRHLRCVARARPGFLRGSHALTSADDHIQRNHLVAAGCSSSPSRCRLQSAAGSDHQTGSVSALVRPVDSYSPNPASISYSYASTPTPKVRAVCRKVVRADLCGADRKSCPYHDQNCNSKWKYGISTFCRSDRTRLARPLDRHAQPTSEQSLRHCY